MKKKKRGSTFVVVVIVMAIIFTTGTTVLALTASNYKMRINESKRLQNLYEADSGLDVVKNIIIKTSQEAIKYADKEVKKEFTKEESKNREEINKIFKEKFYEFLSLNKKELNGKQVEILQYLILKKKIITSVNNDGSIDISTLKSVSEDKNYIIEIEDGDYKINKDIKGDIESITLDVKSTFETVNEDIKNKRTVSTNFEIKAPDYESIISVVDIYPVFDGKAITIDKNMIINGGTSGELSISGDIWVKGGDTDLENNPNFTFDKYKDGIKLNNTKFNIEGNIYTANTFILNNEVKKDSEVNGNIYAKNIYIGKDLYSTISSNNNITFKKDVIVNNDLAMNTTGSTITIENNFYGINDKTSEISTANKALTSSSIIINESQGSNLIVKKNSYISGVAYLNATDSKGNKYQTGESVAIKGNYLAYTDVKDVLDGVNDVTLRYYSPLQLLESINGSSDADTKANYFIDYYSKENKKYEYKVGGVDLQGKVVSAGASVKGSDGKIQKTLIKDEDWKVINNEREEFARNVFAMGDTTNLGENIYENQTVLRTVGKEIDFSSIGNLQIIESRNGTLILNGEASEIIIEDNKLKGKNIEKALIISNGDIKIKGSFNFTGTIITSGNITFEGSEKKEIKYDAEVVRGVIADNYDLVKNIFKKTSSKGKEVKISSSSEMYNVEKFLKQSLWKIER
ncbi:hypothetical protein [uncultured Clostridium sp.]|uniref:hypothetical protein n=1 Tax=uncultured Clostridium sp. TaxID=59620 RepID=UPI00258E4AEB|nr:hypothetical protein [uncultured Clostridium sp.]